ncbi:MAG: tRNA adenosine(34) deaminase TadA [Microbacteriaceae bacterium]
MSALESAMAVALSEALEALATGDVPVGAIVVGPDGGVVGVGHNEREATGDPTAHAEVMALRSAAEATGSWNLSDHTLVVTLEPCVMCAGAILNSRIGRVVFGAWDAKAGAAGSVVDLLRDRTLPTRVDEVIGGVLEAECSVLLTDFFEQLRD